MILSDFGNIVDTEWMKSFEIRNELILHEYKLKMAAVLMMGPPAPYRRTAVRLCRHSNRNADIIHIRENLPIPTTPRAPAIKSCFQ